MEGNEFSCIGCGKLTCDSQNFPYPKGCVTEKIGSEKIENVIKEYLENDENVKLAHISAKIEGNFYGKATRIEETVRFLKNFGAKRVGIATCVGTIREARIFSKILEINGMEPVGVACKVGNRDKTELNIEEENKINPGKYEPFCNPIMQAKFLNEENVDYVVEMGLCVGHDSLFLKYCEKPVTILFTKDRVTGNNAAQPLYLSESYYKKLMKPIE